MKQLNRLYTLCRERRIRQLSLIAILMCLLMYNYIDYIMDIVAYDKKITGNQVYFVKQSGCQIVGMDVMNPTILTYLNEIEDDHCDGEQLLRVQYKKGACQLVVNMQEIEIMNAYNVGDLSELECEYCAVQRIVDNRNRCGMLTIFKLDMNNGVILQMEDEIVRVSCWKLSNRTKPIYKDVFFAIEPPLGWPILEQDLQQKPAEHKLLSTMIVGLDSVSHLNFLRQMKATAHFIRNQLNYVEFWGYNKVGENSYPNLMPLLSGLSEKELYKSCLGDNKKFDGCHFLWNDFKAAGYNTSYGEDSKVIGTFVYGKPGFHKPPTDFYSRPAFVEINRFSRYNGRNEIALCTGGRTFTQVLLHFVYQLLPWLRIKPFFSFFWWADGNHADIMYPSKLDKNFLYLLKTFERQGILNHTLLILMADHGFRFGSFRHTYQGMLEDAQPLLFAIYPPWLEQHYPLAIRNLKDNAHSLITNYDVHETLKDIIDLMNLSTPRIKKRTKQLQRLNITSVPRGISLFLPIPGERSCEHAGIPSHFCFCHRLELLSVDDSRVLRAARYIVERINLLLKPHSQCRQLSLENVLKAYVAKPSAANQTQSAYEIRVHLQTVPGLAQFEATTQFVDYSLSLAGEISRINRYGNQSYCIKNYKVERFCFCY